MPWGPRRECTTASTSRCSPSRSAPLRGPSDRRSMWPAPEVTSTATSSLLGMSARLSATTSASGVLSHLAGSWPAGVRSAAASLRGARCHWMMEPRSRRGCATCGPRASSPTSYRAAPRGGPISVEPRINDRIRVPEVRLVGPGGEQVGIVAIGDALRLAQESDLDLVEVAPTARPPVCKLMDYGKWKYANAQKRFKVTGGGKLMHRQANRNHYLEHKSSSRMRSLWRDTDVSAADTKRVRKLLGR